MAKKQKKAEEEQKDTTSESGTEAQDKKAQGAPASPIVIHAQYLKDLSFENPNTPVSFWNSQTTPQTDMNISMDARKFKHEKIEHLYEVVLMVNATSKVEENTAFLAELVYGAMVSLHGVEESKHHSILLMEVPRLIFPFARQILADATQAGGFPPLMMNPVDFRAMYISKFGNKPADAENAAASA